MALVMLFTYCLSFTVCRGRNNIPPQGGGKKTPGGESLFYPLSDPPQKQPSTPSLLSDTPFPMEQRIKFKVSGGTSVRGGETLGGENANPQTGKGPLPPSGPPGSVGIKALPPPPPSTTSGAGVSPPVGAGSMEDEEEFGLGESAGKVKGGGESNPSPPPSWDQSLTDHLNMHPPVPYSSSLAASAPATTHAGAPPFTLPQQKKGGAWTEAENGSCGRCSMTPFTTPTSGQKWPRGSLAGLGRS